MGTPTIGGQITGAVTEDSGLVITGDLNDIGFGTGNTDDVWSIQSGATYGTATINPATGLWSYDLDDSNPVVNALDAGDTLTDVFTVLMVDADGRSDTQVITITITGVPCFVAGTPIDTPSGPRPVESLRPGDLVLTLDHGPQPLLWTGSCHLDRQALAARPDLRPVRISRDALGPGIPGRDILVSPQHRLLLRSPWLDLALGSPEALVPALRLDGKPGIGRSPQAGPVHYVHLLFERHEIVTSAGLASESLLLGPGLRHLLPPDSLAEIRALIPDFETIGAQRAARPVASVESRLVAAPG
jgi:VCBS repeat-containing protein